MDARLGRVHALRDRCAAAVLVLGLVSLWPSGAAASTGALSQLPGGAGCFTDTTSVESCTAGKGLSGASAIAASPDGHSVYVVGTESTNNTPSVAVFSRATNGALTQLGGAAGCVTDGGVASCTSARGLEDGALDVAVSPDNASVYVAAGSRLVVFSRATSGTNLGALSQAPGTAGCVSQDGTDRSGGPTTACLKARTQAGYSWLAISPVGGGDSVYSGSASINSYVSVFQRATSGASLGQLSIPAGSAGCVGNGAGGNPGGCAVGSAVDNSTGMAISPDGAFAYIVSAYDSSVDVFQRTTSGSGLGGLTEVSGPNPCVVDASGAFAPCTGVRALNTPERAAVSPDMDGAELYVAASGSNGVASFSRDKTTGKLTQLDKAPASGHTAAATDGCITESGNDGESPQAACAQGHGLQGAGWPEITGDGADVYAAAPSDNALALVHRDLSTGVLSQDAASTLPASAPCHSDDGKSNGIAGQCVDGRALAGAAAIAISPDLANIYSADPNSDAIAIFTRTLAPRYAVSGSASPPAGGSVAASSSSAGASCSGASCTVDPGSDVTLAATAASGYRFVGWSGACTNTSGPCQLTNVTADVTATATFVARYTVTGQASPAASGAVAATSPSPSASCAGASCTVDAGSEVDLAAAATPGNRFSGWSDACSGATNPCQLTNVISNQSATATFAPPAPPIHHTLTVSKSGSGSGTVKSSAAGIDCGTTCSAQFGDGTPVTLTAAPSSGSTFTGWSGGCSGTGSCQVMLTADATVAATFAPDCGSASGTPSDSGSLSYTFSVSGQARDVTPRDSVAGGRYVTPSGGCCPPSTASATLEASVFSSSSGGAKVAVNYSFARCSGQSYNTTSGPGYVLLKYRDGSSLRLAGSSAITAGTCTSPRPRRLCFANPKGRLYIVVSGGSAGSLQIRQGSALLQVDGGAVTLDARGNSLLAHVIEGSGSARIGGRAISVSAGQGILVNDTSARLTDRWPAADRALVPLSQRPPKITSLRFIALARPHVRFRLDRAAKVLVRVLSGKRTVQTERAAGHKGSDTVKLRTLHRGRYQLVVSATDSKGRTGLAQQSITVR